MDIRYALRVLWKSPAFTLVALVTLMLGIGANVVVFGVLNAVLLRPLEVSDPQNLYQLRLEPWTSFKLLTTSYPAFEDFRQRNSTFSDMAGFNGYSQARLRWGNAAKSVSGYAVTGNYFDMLGVQPEVGRFFQAADEHGPNSAPYVVLSDQPLATRIQCRSRRRRDDRAARQRSLHGGGRGAGAVPRHGAIRLAGLLDTHRETGRGCTCSTGPPAVTVLGRLKPGVTPQQATEDLNAIAAQLAKEYPETDSGCRCGWSVPDSLPTTVTSFADFFTA